MSLSRLEKAVPLYKKVFDLLVEEIKNGKFKMGTKLNETLISKELGVSRTPVREALRALEAEGWIEDVDSTGFTVFSPSKEDFVQLFECRSALEAMAARHMALFAPDEDIKTLKEIIDETRKALEKKDFEIMLMHNNAFHTLIIESSNNRHLKKIWEPLKSRIFLYRQLLHQLNRVDSFFPEHERIFEAIQKRKGAEAEKAMLEHLQNDCRFAQENFKI